MGDVYRVIKKRCKQALIHSQECIIDVPVSSIDINYSLQGLYDYIKGSFPDYKVRFLEETNQLRLVYKPKLVFSKQEHLKDQTKKLLEQFPDVKKVEFIQVSNEYKPKTRRKRKTV